MGQKSKKRPKTKAMERYKTENRCEKNKKRKALKYAKHMEKCALHRQAKEEQDANI